MLLFGIYFYILIYIFLYFLIYMFKYLFSLFFKNNKQKEERGIIYTLDRTKDQVYNNREEKKAIIETLAKNPKLKYCFIKKDGQPHEWLVYLDNKRPHTSYENNKKNLT